MSSLPCDYCKKGFEKETRRVNEANKFGWKIYCSNTCLVRARSKQVQFVCSNPDYKKGFTRSPGHIKKSIFLYCSRSCAAKINNRKFPKHSGVRKKCKVCDKEFVSREKYCSLKCKFTSQTIKSRKLIQQVTYFYRKFGRIPLKREFLHPQQLEDTLVVGITL